MLVLQIAFKVIIYIYTNMFVYILYIVLLDNCSKLTDHFGIKLSNEAKKVFSSYLFVLYVHVSYDNVIQ